MSGIDCQSDKVVEQLRMLQVNQHGMYQVVGMSAEESEMQDSQPQQHKQPVSVEAPVEGCQLDKEDMTWASKAASSKSATAAATSRAEAAHIEAYQEHSSSTRPSAGPTPDEMMLLRRPPPCVIRNLPRPSMLQARRGVEAPDEAVDVEATVEGCQPDEEDKHRPSTAASSQSSGGRPRSTKDRGQMLKAILPPKGRQLAVQVDPIEQTILVLVPPCIAETPLGHMLAARIVAGNGTGTRRRV